MRYKRERHVKSLSLFRQQHQEECLNYIHRYDININTLTQTLLAKQLSYNLKYSLY